ncbi:hypothetical protein [Variovorax sp. OK605]|uniref:hypothetical protein n=1 Tax=Variovorax sp. OK605 TaxID=1855317 RepID=UPI001C4301A8|nr:hypothetical protein [Variovorax sp. OK605]
MIKPLRKAQTRIHRRVFQFIDEKGDLAAARKNMSSPLQTVLRDETCNTTSVRRIAAMLDQDFKEITTGMPLPRGWQFFMMGADTRRSALRNDGFPGLGVPMPDLGLPRLMLGGRTVAFHHDIPVGVDIVRSSSVQSVAHKTTASGPMAAVTLLHELRLPELNDPALVETQTYLLLAPPAASSSRPNPPGPDEIVADRRTTVVPDETLLFQYSALGFNSHKIHIDREHACNVEGFPDLVVNGGLATLLLTEFLRRDLGVLPASLQTRHIAPLFCNRPITLAADRAGEHWRLRAYDDRNRLAVDMEVTAQ